MMRILLVDDDAFLRDMYALKFTEQGYEVDSVESGAAVVTKLEQGEQYDVIVLDMIMPGMTGVELIKTIKSNYPAATKRCIVLSNQGQDADIAEAKAAGADGYIIKAESIPSEVVAKVAKLMAT